MHKTLINALEYSLQNQTDCIVELEEELLEHKALMDNLVHHEMVKAFTPDELNNRRMNLDYMGGKAEFKLRYRDSQYHLDHTEMCEESILKRVDEYFIYQLNYSAFFKKIAELNRLQHIENFFIEGLVGIGSIKISDQKIGWFFCTEINDQVLTTIQKCGFNYLIISRPHSFNQVSDSNNLFFHTLSFDTTTWKFDFSKIIKVDNGFTIQEYVEFTKKILVIDESSGTIFLTGIKLPGSSGRRFSYVKALTIAGEKGMTKTDFSRLIRVQQSQSAENIVNVDKKRLKEDVAKTFINELDRQEALNLLGLENAEKGDLIRIKIPANEIKVF